MYSNGYLGGTAPAGLEAPGQDNVREIFPGAMEMAPVANRRRTTALRGLGLEAGMATAEYAIATLAAVGFAGLLVVILKSDEVRGFLLNIIRTALSF
ncbi:DUF4244 domain-containing protein [Arthrobacter sp. A2-55]|uniref:DUF4244 domain-containing protein n=1 Tax=Arthrobacter sp. A2-55 TaxID=2897337 RepID=UPI0021CDC88F|nr:DUF4244 domain-containing protein [Arthrobacter sp. A2-55]